MGDVKVNGLLKVTILYYARRKKRELLVAKSLGGMEESNNGQYDICLVWRDGRFSEA